MKKMKTYQKVILITVIVILACAAIPLVYYGALHAIVLGEYIFSWRYAFIPDDTPYGKWECDDPYLIHIEVHKEYDTGYVVDDSKRVTFYCDYVKNKCEINKLVSSDSNKNPTIISGKYELNDDLLTIHDDNTKQDFVFHRVE